MPEVSLFSEVSPALPSSASSPSVPKLLYSRKESAYALGISVRSLDLLIAAGQMKFRRIGRKVLIPIEAVIRYASRDHAQLTQHNTQALAT